MPIAADNWTSLTLFLDLGTQWRVVGTMSRIIWIGLDYVAAKILLDLGGHGADVFADLRLMEASALSILNEAD